MVKNSIMAQLEYSVFYATLAGAMILLGAVVAWSEHIRPQWLEQELRHSVIDFGGGPLTRPRNQPQC